MRQPRRPATDSVGACGSSLAPHYHQRQSRGQRTRRRDRLLPARCPPAHSDSREETRGWQRANRNELLHALDEVVRSKYHALAGRPSEKSSWQIKAHFCDEAEELLERGHVM